MVRSRSQSQSRLSRPTFGLVLNANCGFAVQWWIQGVEVIGMHPPLPAQGAYSSFLPVKNTATAVAYLIYLLLR